MVATGSLVVPEPSSALNGHAIWSAGPVERELKASSCVRVGSLHGEDGDGASFRSFVNASVPGDRGVRKLAEGSREVLENC